LLISLLTYLIPASLFISFVSIFPFVPHFFLALYLSCFIFTSYSPIIFTGKWTQFTVSVQHGDKNEQCNWIRFKATLRRLRIVRKATIGSTSTSDFWDGMRGNE
jgi:hypothetical protein